MLYECNNPIINLVSVAHLSWKGEHCKVKGRPYSALAFRVKGEGRFICNKKDFIVTTNDILYLPQGVSYEAEYTDTEMYVIHFLTAYNDKEPEVFTPQNLNEIYSLFLKINTVWYNKEVGFKAEINSLIYKILSLIGKSLAENTMPKYFLRAVTFVNENFTDSSLNIEKICRYSGCGETQLRKLFNEYYNKTPIGYITDLRLDFARNLITENVSVEQAALLSGFNDPKYFARVVKRKFNCRPKDLKLFGK